MTADQLIASAEQTNSTAQVDQRCSAAFYIGELALWNKQADEAVKRFQQTVASCPKTYMEFGGARAALERLGKPVS